MLEHLRLFFIFLHFVVTTSLYWTKIDVVAVSSLIEDREWTAAKVDALIALSLACIIFKALCYAYFYHRMSIATVIHIAADILGTFFVFWIVLDGWAWQAYVVVVVLFS
jgi:hypothetical protein